MLEVKYLSKNFEVESGLDGFRVARTLDEEKSKVCVALKINSRVVDLTTTIDDGGTIELITSDTAEGLEIIRHSTSHLMAYAVKELYEDVKLGIGPAIEDGFYYDFDIKNPFQESNISDIESKMQEIIERDERFVRKEITKDEAEKLFESLGEEYKLELINAIPEDEKISLYHCGNFFDLCIGPHVPSTRYLKNFKLTKLAGAYWRGDVNNKMLQRIYGVAFDTKENLERHLEFLKEMEKKDHRKICKVMDLLHFEPDYAPGAPFFHKKGLYLYNKLLEYMRKKQDETGYVEIMTPRIMDRSLWEISGHWEKYGEHNYSGKTEDGRQFCIKPMNCPGCILVFKQGIKSYRDLPMKISEFGKVNRYEASGALLGLLRVREFTQDDAHIFCTLEQTNEECKKLIQFLLDIYRDIGFDDNNIIIKLSTRPEKRIGDEHVWDISEKALSDVLNDMQLPFTVFEGEGAFYGPKLEFVLRDCMKRDWQMGTIQLDMNLPERFDVGYVGEDGKKHKPIMFHRAIFGSIERFLGIFIEHTEGKFPLWLSPLQIIVATISQESNDYALSLRERLRDAGLIADVDISNEKISYKVREASLRKVPYIFVVGKNERENNTVTVRIIDSNDNKQEFKVDDVINKIKAKIQTKSRDYLL
ncbi:MAG: threonine--tRNA ligase [Rickettsiales bacterium]|jgi:threonyl-tRNA synthetase|nr:threonine--tRNA ligase [Rickettsiales bacterium]